MDETLFFVGVKDPLELRKDLLISSKNVLNSLKRYDTVMQFKEQKTQVETQLQRVFDELLVLNKKLRNHLPKVPIKGGVEESKKEEPKQVLSKVVPKPNLDVLDEELARVERRLSSLE
ncbi:MAG TPA: hypothetical protein VJJ82_05655 [Candidatus Nanoarchaeia archaeon]|nr:hypothetical protein [Candidatus Nanoarchaeia archaeon]